MTHPGPELTEYVDGTLPPSRTARIERRQMQRTQGVEFRVSGRLDDRTKMRRNGHPSLRIDPVRHMSEEPVQNATPPFPPPGLRSYLPLPHPSIASKREPHQ